MDFRENRLSGSFCCDFLFYINYNYNEKTTTMAQTDIFLKKISYSPIGSPAIVVFSQ
jgi:hypothetical protein